MRVYKRYIKFIKNKINIYINEIEADIGVGILTILKKIFKFLNIYFLILGRFEQHLEFYFSVF